METATIPASTPGAPSPSPLLSGSLITPETWVDGALCAQAYPDAFFPDSDTPERSTADALKLCASCPVRDECLTYALTHDERYGIWGGLTSRQRRRIKPLPRAERSTLCARGHDRVHGRSGPCKQCEQERKRNI